MERYWAIVDEGLRIHHLEFTNIEEAKNSLLQPVNNESVTCLGVYDTHTNDMVYRPSRGIHHDIEVKDVELRKYIDEHNPLPKSIHTWLDSNFEGIYSYDVEVCIQEFPANVSIEWLYFFALTVYFTEFDEWAHGGLQWAQNEEFKGKGINWGGGSSYTSEGGIGRTNVSFAWKVGNWYRYRVWRLRETADGLHAWGFWVMDYETGVELKCGEVCTKSKFIKNAQLFTETGYGVRCNSSGVQVEWRNPLFKASSISSESSPNRVTANYNGTCRNPSNTNQGVILESPLTLYHQTNSIRTVEPGSVIFMSE